MNKQPNPSTCVVPPSGGRVIRAFGDEITVHLGAAETGGKYTMFTDVTPSMFEETHAAETRSGDPESRSGDLETLSRDTEWQSGDAETPFRRPETQSR